MSDKPNCCAQLMYAGTLETPPEYCDNEADPDSDYCAYHTAPDLWDRADEARDFAIADRFDD